MDGSQRSHLDALADGDPLRALRGATALLVARKFAAPKVA